MGGNPDRPRRETRPRARDAVDSKRAKDVLAETADKEVKPDEDTVETLRAAAAEETVEVA